jgi:hypothetical protein
MVLSSTELSGWGSVAGAAAAAVAGHDDSGEEPADGPNDGGLDDADATEEGVDGALGAAPRRPAGARATGYPLAATPYLGSAADRPHDLSTRPPV